MLHIGGGGAVHEATDDEELAIGLIMKQIFIKQNWKMKNEGLVITVLNN